MLGVTYPTALGLPDPSRPKLDWRPPASVSFGDESAQSPKKADKFSFSYSEYNKAWMGAVTKGLNVSKIPLSLKVAGNSNVFAYCRGVQMIFDGEGGVCDTPATGSNYKTMLIVGGSHMSMLVPAILGAVNLAHWRVIAITSPSCTFLDEQIDSHNTFYKPCVEAHSYLNTYLTNHRPDLMLVNQHVLVSENQQKLGFDPNTWRASFLRFKKQVKRLVLISPTVGTASIPECMSKNGTLSKCQMQRHSGVPGLEAANAVAKNAGISVIDPNEFVCTQQLCPNFIGQRLVTHDGQHYTYGLSDDIAPLFAHELARLNLAGVKTFKSEN